MSLDSRDGESILESLGEMQSPGARRDRAVQESKGVKQATCQRCNLVMNTVTLREWAVKLCPRCEGTFYEGDTLESLLQQPDLRLSYLRPALLANLSTTHPPEESRSRIDCPNCSEVMTRELYAGKGPVSIDRCEQCHGIWLDDGELGLLFTDREINDPQPVPSFAEGLRRLLGFRPKVQEPNRP